jgi:hypothetical protein
LEVSEVFSNGTVKRKMGPRANDFPSAIKRMEVCDRWCSQYWVIRRDTWDRVVSVIKRMDLGPKEEILLEMLEGVKSQMDYRELYYEWYTFTGRLTPMDDVERKSLLMNKERDYLKMEKYKPIDYGSLGEYCNLALARLKALTGQEDSDDDEEEEGQSVVRGVKYADREADDDGDGL